MKLRSTLCVFALLTLAAPAAAEFCKYVDRDGNMHYSNVEPEKGWKLLEQPSAEGFRAGLLLLRRPEQTVELLQRELRPEPKRDVKRIAALAREVAKSYYESRERLGFPMLAKAAA